MLPTYYSGDFYPARESYSGNPSLVLMCSTFSQEPAVVIRKFFLEQPCPHLEGECMSVERSYVCVCGILLRIR